MANAHSRGGASASSPPGGLGCIGDTTRPEAGPFLIPAASRFPAQWAELPTHAKVLHILAHRAGLEVTHTDGMRLVIAGVLFDHSWLWIGTADSFRASGLLNASTNYGFTGWGECHTGEGLSLTLARDEKDAKRIYAAHDRCGPIAARSLGRFLQLAATDGAFQAVRARMLQPVPQTIRVEVSCLVVDGYKARGVFPEVTQEPARADRRLYTVEVSTATAQAMLADAQAQIAKDGTRKAAAKWWLLRNRLQSDLEQADAEGRDSEPR